MVDMRVSKSQVSISPEKIESAVWHLANEPIVISLQRCCDLFVAKLDLSITVNHKTHKGLALQR